jgi:hypothetical protein
MIFGRSAVRSLTLASLTVAETEAEIDAETELEVVSCVGIADTV